MTESNWGEYHEIKKEAPPSSQLIAALEHVKNKGTALDLGAGALADSKYLLKEGFEVTAIDNAESSSKLAQEVGNQQFTFIQTNFDQFNYPVEAYDLVNASLSLPFNPPETFNDVFAKVKKSLKPGGILVCQLFGTNHSWTRIKNRTFHTMDEVKALLNDMKIIRLNEKEFDANSTRGFPEHFHNFYIIAEK